MRSFFILTLVLMGASLSGAEFSLRFCEASHEPREGFVEQGYKGNQRVYIGPDSGITLEHIARLSRRESQGETMLSIVFTPAGAQMNNAFTTRMLKQPIALFINKKLVSVARVMAPSTAECVISGPTEIEIDQFVAAFSAK